MFVLLWKESKFTLILISVDTTTILISVDINFNLISFDIKTILKKIIVRYR